MRSLPSISRGRRWFAAWSIAGVLPCVVAASAFAQETKEEAAPPEPTPIVSIPVDKIIESAAQLESRLSDIDDPQGLNAISGQIEEQIASLDADIAALRTRIDENLDTRFSASNVAPLEASVGRLRDTIASARTSIADKVSALEAQLQHLREEKERWEITRDEMTDDSVTETVRTRVTDTLQGIAGAVDTLINRQNAAIDLQARLETNRASLEEAGDLLVDARKALANSMGVAQAAPLWEQRISARQLREDVRTLAKQWGENFVRTPAYARRHQGILLLQFAIILALGLALRRAGKTVRKHLAVAEAGPSASSFQSALASISRPWSAALLVGIVISPFLHPERGNAERALMLLLGVTALLRVIWVMIPRDFHWPMVGLVGVCFLYLVGIRDAGSATLEVLLLLFEAALGLALLLWIRRRLVRWMHRATSTPGTGVSFVRGITAMLIIILASASVAVSLGYLNLTEWILELTCVGLMTGLAWYAAIRIVETLFTSLLLARHIGYVRSIHRQREHTIRLVRILVRIAGTCGWAYLFLVSLHLWSPIRSALSAFLGVSIGIGSVQLSVGGVLAFCLTLVVTWFLARALSIVLDEEIFPRVRLQPGVPYALKKFSRYTLYVLGFVLALAMLHFPVTQLALVISALGVGIGFGLQNIINNFVSGVVLLFERPIRVGDRIQLGELIGDVERIGIRASNVRTFDGANVIVPNGDLISSQVTNWTFSDRSRRLILPVGVAYGTEPQRVLDILGKVAEANEETLAHPEPELLFVGFGDSSLDFELRAWTVSQRGWLAVRSDLGVAVDQALKDANIEIPFPQRDLHLRSMPPAAELPTAPTAQATPHRDAQSSTP